MDDKRQEDDRPGTSRSDAAGSEKSEKKPKKPIESGIIYLATIPYNMGSNRLREMFSVYGKVGKIYLQPETRKAADGKKMKKYAEGWIEFADKRLAKRIAYSLNNTPVGGKKRSKAFECLWNMKYLKRFKWVHLTEQLSYERAVHAKRMQAEVSQAKRQASFFAAQVEKGSELAALEERVLKKGGKWELYQRRLQQKQPVQPKNKHKKEDDKLMAMIFE